MADSDAHITFLERLPAFLELLRARNILTDIDDYERVYHILDRVDSNANLKTILAPVLVSSVEEQAVFYELFDRFFAVKKTGAQIDFTPATYADFGKYRLEGWKKQAAAKKEKTRKEKKQSEDLLFKLIFRGGIVLALALIAWLGLNVNKLTQGRDLLLFGSIFILWAIFTAWIIRFRNRKLVVRRVQAKQPPYFWNIDLDIKERIDFGIELPLLARYLRRRLPGNTPHFNPHTTLKKTIANAGALDLQYNYRTRPAEYIFLIDNTSLANHQTHLFELLYRQLIKNNVYVERFYYHEDMRTCWNEQHPNGLPLEQIAQRYADYRLLIFGDAWKMINPTNGRLLNWTQVFAHWTDRAILTPKPSGGWAFDELSLSEMFVVLPSNLDGLLEVVAHFEALKKSDLKAWRDDKTQPEIDLNETHLIAELAHHFSEKVQTWIAACAIYPELSWDLTLYIGEWLSSYHFGTSLLTFDHVIQLAQLPWFKHGQIPEGAREQLVDVLDDQLRMNLHQALVNVLEAQLERDEGQLPPNSHAYGLFKLQLAIHKLESGNYDQEQQRLKKEVKQLIREGVEHDFLAIQSVKKASRLDIVLSHSLKRMAFRPDASWNIWTYFGGIVGSFWFKIKNWYQATLPESDVVEPKVKQQEDWDDITHPFWKTLLQARRIAAHSGNIFLEPAHIMMAILEDSPNPVSLTLESLEVSLQQLEEHLRELIQSYGSSDALMDEHKVTEVSLSTSNIISRLMAEEDIHFVGDPKLDKLAGIFREIEDDKSPSSIDFVIALLQEERTPILKILADLDVDYAFFKAEYNYLFHNEEKEETKGKKGIIKRLREQIAQVRTKISTINTALILEDDPFTRSKLKDQLKKWEKQLQELTARIFQSEKKETNDSGNLLDDSSQVVDLDFPKPEMVEVEGGTIMMGSDADDAYDDEKPVHEVSVAAFQMGKYPVTVKEYLAFVEATNTNQPEWIEEGSEYNVKTGTDDHYKTIGDALTNPDCPIVGISWYNAIAYCNWLSEKAGLEPVYTQKGKKITMEEGANGFRLPTEAEWEFAARGGVQTNSYLYSGSDQLDEVGWYDENSEQKTHPVGKKMPNELGLYDMSGNVREWCEDDWHKNYQDAPTDGRAWIDTPDRGAARVYRGGSWDDDEWYCRVSFRGNYGPTLRDYTLGFRVVSSLSS